MKKILIVILLLMLATSGAAAESVMRDALLDACVEISLWQDAAREGVTGLGDSEAEQLLEVVSDTLTVTGQVLMDALVPDNDFTGAVGAMQGYAPEFDAQRGYCASGTRWISDLGVYCEVETMQTDNFLSALLIMYDKAGTLLGMQRVEMGRRDGQMMILLVDYDHVNWMTGRFAMYPDDTSGRVIFTKTLGQNMDIVLDVQAWAQGADVKDWNKQLLLPETAR